MASTLNDFILIIIVLLIVLYYYGMRKYSIFNGRAIKCIQPSIPFVGNTARIYCQMEHLIDFSVRNYINFPEEKYIGYYEFQRPMVFIRDLEIVKLTMVKDFEHFFNHRDMFPENCDPFFGNTLFFLKGERWRDMRASLSPAFTSSKMRNMFQLVQECAKGVSEYYIGEIHKSTDKLVEIEVKDELSKFTNDVIATSAFGLKIDSFRNKDNEFYQMGMNSTRVRGMQMVKFIGYTLIPKIMKFCKISFLSQRAIQFFRNIVLNTMKHRNENNVVRYDMIHLLMELKKGSLKYEQDSTESSDTGFATVQESSLGKREIKRKWGDDELVAQAFLFYMAGFDGVSTLLTFFIYEMVRNPDIQKKIQDEIDEHNSKHDGKFVYDDLKNLKYIDMCISETLRLWPPAVASDRACTKTYNLPPSNDSTTAQFQINPGENIWVPIFAIHHDPKYYPNPERFDPERFSDENKPSLEPLAYMPFGSGPRNCIGSRFALMVMKIIVFNMLSEFDLVTTKKTIIPVVISKSSMNLYTKDGVYVGLKPRAMK